MTTDHDSDLSETRRLLVSHMAAETRRLLPLLHVEIKDGLALSELSKEERDRHLDTEHRCRLDAITSIERMKQLEIVLKIIDGAAKLDAQPRDDDFLHTFPLSHGKATWRVPEKLTSADVKLLHMMVDAAGVDVTELPPEEKDDVERAHQRMVQAFDRLLLLLTLEENKEQQATIVEGMIRCLALMQVALHEAHARAT